MLFKKSILLIILLFVLITIPVSFADDNVTGINDDNQINDVYTQDLNDDVLTAGKVIYFNASVEKDGDGSLERPYKYLTSQKIGNGNTLHFANGEYSLSRSLSIYSSTFIGEDADKTIINQNGYSITVSSSLTLSDLTLYRSHVENNAGALTATNVIFDSCRAKVSDDYDGSFGGAIGCFVSSSYYSYYYPEATLDNCTFINNTAVYGGAIYSEAGTVNVYNSKFINNYAENYGGAIAGEYDSNVKIENSIFIGDYSINNAGGAIYVSNSKLNVDNSTFDNCNATFGSAICDLNSTSTITSLIASNNVAGYEGGVIYKMYGTISVSKSEFTNNRARDGGAIFIDNATSFTLRYNDFIRNSALLCGGAVYSILNGRTNFVENNYVGNTAVVENNLYSSDSYSLQIGSGDYELVNANYTFNNTLPSKYNLFDEGLLTPIKDQQTSGNCWAFASIAALESCLLKATNITYDLSEENMKNLIEIYSDYGWNMMTNNGGYDEMAIGYLTSWMGPVNESSDVFDDYSLRSPLINSIFHIQNILYLGRESYTDNDAIKQAIMTYGAVSTGIYYSSYYLSSRNAYYYPSTGYANHAVAIVGWDDNYSRSNFITSPRGDGAWIAKNSWGEDWGSNGYFYVSYYDAIFAKVGDPHYSYTFIFNDTLRFDKNYQYDIPGITDFFITGRDTIWYKNNFNATDNELLAAFSTYFNTTTDWEAYIYVNDDLKLTQNGTNVAGYFTINLNQFIPLAKGDTFTVALKITAPEYASFPVSENVSLSRTLYYPGVSFFSYDGEKWYDLYDYKLTNYDHTYSSQVACIKAFTMFNELTTKITVENINTTVETLTSIIANITDNYGNPVGSGIVNFLIDGEEHIVNVSDGIANLTYTFGDTGDYNISASFEFDSLFVPSNTTATVHVDKSDVNLEIMISDVLTYDNIEANINLHALNSNPINGTVILTINNKKYNVIVENGSALFTLTDYLTPGEYEASLYFEESDLFNSANTTANFTVSIRNITLDANVSIVDVYNVRINVILSDSINGTLTAVLNDEKYTINYTDGNGELFLNKRAYDNYTVFLLFEKEGYISANFTDEFELKPIKTTINSTDIVMYYRDGTRFNITLLNEDNECISNQTVTININGNSYTRTTDENGSVSLALNLNSGNYTVFASYNGTDIYVSSNKTNNITIITTLTAEDIVKYYKNDTQFYVTLYGAKGELLVNKNVTMNINGVFYNRTTNESGVARLNINLNPGEYILTVINLETDERISSNITVLSRLAEATNLVKYYRNSTQFTLKVLDKQGNTLDARTVKFNINGVFYYRVSDENGIVTMNINLHPGEYIITAEYDGCKISNNVTVLSTISASDLSMSYRDGSKFTARVLDSQGKANPNQNVTFNINGVLYNRISDINGLAELNINLMSGEYIITSTYNGLSESNTITIKE